MTSERIEISLREWESLTPADHEDLKGSTFGSPEAVYAAELLAKQGILEVAELRTGLKIRAFAHVGRIELGNVSITVEPKLDHSSFLSLLGYAYGLSKVKLLDEAGQPLGRSGFVDLLVLQLVTQANELVARGIHRAYVPIHDQLATPRGRIDLQGLIAGGGLRTASLPCMYHPRVEDALLNRVLLAGIQLGAGLANDLRLRGQAKRLAALLTPTVTTVRLDFSLLRRCQSHVNRLTAAYRPILTLIGLLLEGLKASFAGNARTERLSGFLFDMNRFFQALVTRFLQDSLPDCRVTPEAPIPDLLWYLPTFNPLNKRAPRPRPDLLVTRDGSQALILDVKYRDLWQQPLPDDMLYQLVLYAISHSPAVSAILYPTTDSQATEARIAARVFGKQAEVHLRPIVLGKLQELISAGHSAMATRQRRSYAERLIGLSQGSKC